MGALGGEALIGHSALAVLLPLVLVALWYSYRAHRRPLPPALGLGAAAVGYPHILAGTPEWTMYATAALGVLAAVLDWRASTRWGRACPVPASHTIRPTPPCTGPLPEA